MMHDETRAVAQALVSYAQDRHGIGRGPVKSKQAFETATAVLRENDDRNKPGHSNPAADYEVVLLASASALDYLVIALGEATGQTRTEVYTDLREFIAQLPTPDPH